MTTSKKKKEFYEAEIEARARAFFNLPKDDTDNSVQRNTCKEQLWIALWKYYKEILYAQFENESERTADLYSGVINETIAKAMSAYQPENETPFLHYVNAAVKNEISHERQKNYLHGLKVPQKIRRHWNQLYNLAQLKGIDTVDTAKLRQLGLILGYSETEICAAIDYAGIGVHSNIRFCNGEEIDVFDSLVSPVGNPEVEYERQCEIDEHIRRFKLIDDCFAEKQERVKPYVSALLTLEVYQDLSVLCTVSEEQCTFTFIDTALFEELKNCGKNHTKPVTQQEIAARFGRDKTDASRTLRRFLDEVKEKLSTL